MFILVIMGAASFLIALVITPICAQLFSSFGIVDRPDHERKLHTRPVARVGGIPLAIAYLAPFGLLFLFPGQKESQMLVQLAAKWELAIAAAIVFATGLCDDIWSLKPWQKLSGQTAAALLVCWSGVRIIGYDGHLFGTVLSIAVTVVWLVGCSNAFNLIDGLDGLACGVGILATITVLLSGILNHDLGLVFLTVPLAASLAGFLRYNFAPATIFLGDAGSLLVGFLLGYYAVIWSHKSATLLGLMAPVTALAFPLLDTALAIVRRFLRGRPIFSGDRAHIHHRLLDRGLTPRRAILYLYGFCSLAAVLSLIQSMHVRFAAFILLIACGGIWIGIQYLGYVEFGAIARLLAHGTFRKVLHSDIQLDEFRRALGNAATPDACWQTVRGYYTSFGFTGVRLRMAGQTYFETLPSEDPADSWSILVPLDGLDYAEFSRGREVEEQLIAMSSFADTVGAALKSKLAGLLANIPEAPDETQAAAPPHQETFVHSATD